MIKKLVTVLTDKVIELLSKKQYCDSETTNISCQFPDSSLFTKVTNLGWGKFKCDGTDKHARTFDCVCFAVTVFLSACKPRWHQFATQNFKVIIGQETKSACVNQDIIAIVVVKKSVLNL